MNQPFETVRVVRRLPVKSRDPTSRAIARTSAATRTTSRAGPTSRKPEPPVWDRLVAANVPTMTGPPPPVGCGWSERRSGSDDYVAHLGEAHLPTLRDIGFANA